MFRGVLYIVAVLIFGMAGIAGVNPTPIDSPFTEADVKAGTLPPVAERIPSQPMVVNLPGKNRQVGRHGGTLRTMITRSKDIRQMVVYGYARLVGYDQGWNIVPDILRDVEVEEGRKFTLYLRAGHKWSDGHPFTSADFEYWWTHVANNKELTPSGPQGFLRVEGELPKVQFPDATTVIFEWSKPNPEFLQTLAEARPPFIYRPAHYLKQFHAEFADQAKLEELIKEKRARSWAAVHNKYDNMYKFNNHALPTLQPWMKATKGGKSRFLFVRNPFYHRIDNMGQQLPYVDTVEMTVVGAGLVAAKTNAGETDLQARGLAFGDVAILKKGEMDGGNYRTFLWRNGAAAQIAIYPNLNYNDPVWREVLRDVRFRRALSMAIDRRIINRALYFGLGKEGGMTVLEQSPFYREENRRAWATYDPDAANALLDDMGLTERDSSGIRLLPDGRPLWVIVETAGERPEVEDALQITVDTWREIGVKLILRPLERDILRNRVYSGVSMAAAWFGWDNGIPKPFTPPSFAAPHQQEFFSWPKWGQFYQTGGQAGEVPDMPEAKQLMELADAWAAADLHQRANIWQEIVDIHAQQVFAIGIVSATPQPVVVSNRMRNVPEEGVWIWSPGSHFGVYRPDEFFFAEPEPGHAGSEVAGDE